MSRLSLLVMVVLVHMPKVLAQQAAVTGMVTDHFQHSPIEFATVTLHRGADQTFVTGVATDAQGKFTLEKLSEGTYRVTVQFLGYQAKILDGVRVRKDQSVDIGTVSLAPSAQLLEEITVTGQKAAVYHYIDKQVYAANQFQAATGGTASDVLKNLPSVSVDAQGGITVRGSSGFLVLLDGKPTQADPALVLSQLPANAVENIEIITAPSAKYDADGKAGIINITTKAGVANGFSVVGNAMGGLPSVNDFDNKEKPRRYGADATITYQTGKWDVSLGTSYTRNDLAGRRVGDVNTTLGNRFTSFPSAGERSTDKYNYFGRAAVGFNPDQHNALRAGLYYGIRTEYRVADIHYANTTTDLATGQRIGQIAYYNANLVRKHGTFTIGNLDYTHTFANRSTLSASGLYEHDQLSGFTKNLNLRAPESTDTLQYTHNTNERPLTGYRLKVDYQLPVGPGKLESGYQYRYLEDQGSFVYWQKDRNYDPLTYYPEFSGDVSVRNTIHSLYAQFAGTRGKKLSYVGGLRYEYSNRELTISSAGQPFDLTLRNLFPSASVLYRFTDAWQVKAAYSRRVQRTTSLELNPLPEREHSETLEQGDPNLLPEFISLAELGVIRTLKRGSVFATAYYQGIENAVNRVNSVYADTILNRIYTNAGNARRLGVEAGLDVEPIERWKMYLGGNLYHYRIKGELFNNSVAVNNASLVYSLNFTSSLQLSKTLVVQGSLNYLSNRATAQGEDSRFFTPNVSLKKTWLDGRLSAMFQWQSIDLGLLRSNEQRITTWGSDFYTTTNYIYEKDVLLVNLSYTLKGRSKKVKFTESEFGEKEF